MRTQLLVPFVVLASMLAAGPAAAGPSDAAYFRMEPFQGESANPAFLNQIVVQSFTFGGQNHAANPTVLTTGAGTAKLQMHDLKLTKLVDKASPLLFAAVGSGKPVVAAVLSVVRPGTSTLLAQVQLSDVAVSGYEVGTATPSGLPIETVTLSFTRVKFVYFPLTPDGKPGAPMATCVNWVTNTPPAGPCAP
jgi:type VI secretion system Hcp family effector